MNENSTESHGEIGMVELSRGCLGWFGRAKSRASSIAAGAILLGRGNWVLPDTSKCAVL